MTTGQIPTLSGLPFDDIRAIVDQVPNFDEDSATKAKSHQHALVFPMSERGRLGQLMPWLAGWQGKDPICQRIELCLFASAHGWLKASDLEQAEADARRRILLLSAGGAAANTLAARLKAGLRVFDLAIERPTNNPLNTAAMTDRDCVAAMAFGMEAIATRPDIVCLSAFGAGTRVAACAIALSLYGGSPADWLACPPETLSAPLSLALDYLLALQNSALWPQADALLALQMFGGRELAATVGAILAARSEHVPVILDGFEACVAAAVASRLKPGLIDHCLVAGREGSAAHDRLLDALHIEPLIDLQLSGSEGLGGLLAAQILQAACDLHHGVATQAQMDALLSDTPSQT